MVAESRLSPAAELARMLGGGITFTALAEKLAGEPVEAEITARWGSTCLTERERELLETWRGRAAPAAWRSGFLRTESGARVAEIQAVYLPARIPDQEVRDQLTDTAVPLGKALARYDLSRETLSAELVPGAWSPLGARLAVLCTGRLWLGGDPVALATEWVYASFTDAGDW
jgi:hypothetical protein